MRGVDKLILSTLFLISLGEINLFFYLCNTNLNQRVVMETYSSEEIRKAIDKVRKLLALVGNNDSPAQIQAALMKVQELQAKYGFHVSELQSEEVMANQGICIKIY